LRKLRAAYSGSAVRVRRDVDGTELDFGFDSNGNLDTSSILDFVNVTETLPADYGSGAVAAYSLRKLRAAYSGSAVRVRRSSDNTEQDIGFTTQGELDTASLLSFVNEEITDNINTTTDSNSDGLADGLTKLTNNPTATIVTGNGHIGSAQRMEYNVGAGTLQSIGINTLDTLIGQEITVSFMYRSNISFSLGNGNGSAGGNFNNIPANTGDAIRYEHKGVWSPVSGSDGRLQPMWLDASGEFIEISDWSVTYHTADGLVSTWYDQSLSNDATQSTAANQPKIVDAGVLVTENGKPAIDFDGVDDRLITSSFASTLAQPSTTFIVNNAPNNTSNNTLIDGIIGSNRHLLIANANNYTLNAGAFVNTGANSDAQSLLYTLWNGASSEFASDGGTPNIINIGTHGLTGLTIGTNFGSSNANDGNVQEIILYNSDQSSNRPSIEANINSYYSIYTPTTNGFVVTWYDQSGNSNDATQGTPTAQPKIVSGGAVITEGTSAKPAIDFDGVSSSFNVSKITLSDDYNLFITHKLDANSYYFGDTIGGDYLRYRINDSYRLEIAGVTVTVTGVGDITGAQKLLNIERDSSNNLEYYLNGTSAATTSISGAWDIDEIGASVTNHFDGTFQELIIYNSDQSSNRTAIETNINTFYAVYPDFSVSGLLHDYPNAAAAYSVRQLTIYNNGYKEKLIRIRRSSGGETDVFADDSYELSLNSRVSAGGTLGNWIGSDDGFVKTWYDQSTNGNDATQSTPAAQPKIVSGGSLATLGSEVTPVRQGVTTTLDVSGIESSVTGAFTIATRFYLSSQSDSDCIFGGRGLTAGAGICASYLSGAWRFEVITTIGTRVIISVSDTNTPINNWHNVIFTWDGTTNSNAVKVYLNTSSNVFSATANGTVINYDASYPMSIFNADRNSFDGGLATWDIWNSQITDIDGLFTALDETAFDLT
jgi:hypothetical protein